MNRAGDRMTVRKIPHRNIALVLAAVLLLVPFTGTASADACTVADPTGTPLNVRKRPSQHAPIIGALNNGITVSTRMSRGDWVHIVPHEAPGKSGWVWRKFIDCPDEPRIASQPDTLPKLPEGIDIAWRCDGVIIAIIENQLEGVSRGGTYLQDDVERTVWIYNPLRVLEGQPFIFKQYETAHPYSTWSAELNGNPCQARYFATSLPEVMRDLAKIVRLEKSDEFKHCLKENPDEHQMCRDTAEKKTKTTGAAQADDDDICGRFDQQCKKKERALAYCDLLFDYGYLLPGDQIGACYAKATNNRCDGSLDGSRAQVCTDWVDDHPKLRKKRK
jgi:hypothetical protein